MVVDMGLVLAHCGYHQAVTISTLEPKLIGLLHCDAGPWSDVYAAARETLMRGVGSLE